ncbi:MAG TPA: serine/threonine-protein kinase [Candidatus Dormibacteraeota bacterium]|nr:serine/threonine-protein kinase [Candidatus Dormibacteraeota bacterium]
MAAILPGTRLGRYEVDEYLGQGSLGPVYRATDQTLGAVAIQVLTGLAAEARVAYQELVPRLVALRHPNLAGVLDFGEHDAVPFLVQEYAPGGPLATRMWGTPLGEAGILRLLGGVAEGLDHAHRAGIVHGGLRPERVLLATDGRALVADAGLESLRPPGGPPPADLTPERAAYLAPEQVAGQPATAASDRCALATLAYQLLAGGLPFTGRASDVLRAQLHGQPAPPSRVSPRLGRATERVLLRGLAREPAARWQAGVQFVTALREAVRQDATPAAAERPAARRRWWPWALAGGVVGLAVAALVGFLVWRSNQPATPSVSVSSAVVQAGGAVTVGGSHLPANQVGSIELASSRRSIGAFQADRYGSVQQDVRIPDDAAPGGHVLSLCWQDRCPAGAKLTITERPPSPTPTPAPSVTPTPTLTPTPTATPAATPTPLPQVSIPAPSAPAPTASP